MNKPKSLSFKVDSQTSKNLLLIKNYYSKDSKISRRVTNGEIIKQLINCHHEEISKHKNTFHLYEMRVKMLEKQSDNQ
tara:strand:+ start:435 stop:668 length:234 start_codon:yes stop_codon:yes gene_type:complete